MIPKLSYFALVLFLVACHSPKGNMEIIESFHGNGNHSVLYEYDKDIDGGLYKEFYPNGRLQIQRQILNGEIVAEKIIDINGRVLVNYIIKNGEYYGLLGSSSCFNVFTEDKLTVVE